MNLLWLQKHQIVAW